MASARHDDEMIVGINVTPLVDIVLVLLIILMVTAAYVASEAIPMDLPDDALPSNEPLPTISIALDAESRLSVDGEPATWLELEQRARAFARREAEPRAVIAADPRTSHGEFVRIVDVLRSVGIERYAVNVDPRETAR